MDRPVVKSAIFSTGMVAYYAATNQDGVGPVHLRRDGTLSTYMYDGSGPLLGLSFTAADLGRLTNSAWFETEAEALANVEKHFPTAKPKKPRAKRKYYKVVRVSGSRLVSAAPAVPDQFQVVYQEGQDIKPRVEGTKLFVFGSLDKANSFRRLELSFHTTRVYECEVTNPHPVKNMGHAGDATKFWSEYRKYRTKRKSIQNHPDRTWFLRTNIPQSSYYVDSLKLIKEVK